jgi:recombination protein RecA
MFSKAMALPAHLLERLPPGVTRGAFEARGTGEEVLPFGIPELDSVLPGGGIARGAVVELAVASGAALATSLSLSACRSAQQQAFERGGEIPWCAFLDASATLYAPAVVEASVVLDRLLVLRPPLEALGRTALRAAESQVFAVLVIDTVGAPGAELDVSLGMWPRIIRRLAMAIEGTLCSVVLITDVAARRPLTLPVAQRIELNRPTRDKLVVRVAKDRSGRIGSPRSINWHLGAQPGERLQKSAPSAGERPHEQPQRSSPWASEALDEGDVRLLA